MSRFLIWHKCDWCSKWTWFRIGWFKKEENELVNHCLGTSNLPTTRDYCSQACLEKKTLVQDFNGRIGNG